jgi:phosphatidylglycerophosphatase A
VFFRIFDITKIWPANWAEQRLKGGLAVMLDDVVAGLYAGVASLILLRFIL